MGNGHGFVEIVMVEYDMAIAHPKFSIVLPRHPAVLFPKKMAQVSEVETMDLHLVDPACYEGLKINKNQTNLKCG